MSEEALTEAVLALDKEALPNDKLELLKLVLPTDNERSDARKYMHRKCNLRLPDRYVVALLKIPRLVTKIDIMELFSCAEEHCALLDASMSVVSTACRELEHSPRLHSLLEVVLRIGNFLNRGNIRGRAAGVRLFTLSKLESIRARSDPDGFNERAPTNWAASPGMNRSSESRYTLLHVVAKACVEKSPDLVMLREEVSHLADAAAISIEIIEESYKQLKEGLQTVQAELEVCRHEDGLAERFAAELEPFEVFLNEEVSNLSRRRECMHNDIKSMTTFYGEDPSKLNLQELLSMLASFCTAFERAHESNIQQEMRQAKSVRIKETSAGLAAPKLGSQKHDESSDSSDSFSDGSSDD
mmetsp:Transcript_16447/g.31545  ORF Transcript_16447/g.31545 Transcript_16447/m.31545 type:complete len:356 (-) Transcript_16447:589-1656(-)